MKKHHLLWLLAAVLVIGLAAGCGDDDDDEAADTAETTAEERSFEAGTTMARLQEEGRIRIGVKYDVPPFGFRNPQTDEIEGFDVDLGKAVADALGVEAEFVEAISDNRIPFIQDGTVDLILSTMTINEERAQEIGFTDPYFIAHGRILVPQDSDIQGIEDLAGNSVCTAIGSTYQETLREEAPEADLRLVDTYSECLELLQNGAVDAISTDDVILTGMIIQDDSLKLVGDELTVEPYGAGFRRGDDEFGEFLNEVIAEYKADGRWQERYDFWLGRHTGEEQTPPDATLEDALEGNIE